MKECLKDTVHVAVRSRMVTETSGWMVSALLGQPARRDVINLSSSTVSMMKESPRHVLLTFVRFSR